MMLIGKNKSSASKYCWLLIPNEEICHFFIEKTLTGFGFYSHC
jgi:hypothetical protein